MPSLHLGVLGSIPCFSTFQSKMKQKFTDLISFFYKRFDKFLDRRWDRKILAIEYVLVSVHFQHRRSMYYCDVSQIKEYLIFLSYQPFTKKAVDAFIQMANEAQSYEEFKGRVYIVIGALQAYEKGKPSAKIIAELFTALSERDHWIILLVKKHFDTGGSREPWVWEADTLAYGPIREMLVDFTPTLTPFGEESRKRKARKFKENVYGNFDDDDE